MGLTPFLRTADDIHSHGSTLFLFADHAEYESKPEQAPQPETTDSTVQRVHRFLRWPQEPRQQQRQETGGSEDLHQLHL